MATTTAATAARVDASKLQAGSWVLVRLSSTGAYVPARATDADTFTAHVLAVQATAGLRYTITFDFGVAAGVPARTGFTLVADPTPRRSVRVGAPAARRALASTNPAHALRELRELLAAANVRRSGARNVRVTNDQALYLASLAA